MAKNITLMGASYTDVPAVTLPQTGGGTASFTDVTDTTATTSDVAQGKVFYAADGKKQVGTGEQTTRIDNLLLDAMTEPSASFPVPAVGDNGSTLFGKISKWFSDMAALVATKFNAANVVNNLTTTASGYALDARQGKTLNDLINNMAVIVTETYVEASITQGIPAGGGRAWTGLGGSAIVPTVLSGYTFAGNVNVTVNGAVAVYATFDGSNQYNSRSVNPYISNASPNALSSGTRLGVRLYSLCYRK